MRIAHLTSVHSRADTRIFIKQCQSLAGVGFEVSLIVADGLGNDYKPGIAIFDVGKSDQRWQRIITAPKRVFKKAMALDADIYHLHDPELLPTGIKLKRLGKKVIFDAHEDFPQQLLAKPYLPSFLKKPLSLVAKAFEKYACKKFDAIVAATPHIRDKFAAFHSRVGDINNFPIMGELTSESSHRSEALTKVCYVGGISEIRGIKEMTQAMLSVKAPIRLTLAGELEDSQLSRQLRDMPSWSRVDAVGFLSRSEVQAVYHNSFVGLVVLHPVANYLDALPVKMFEYMAAGLPVIASNFPLWRKIIDDAKCGVCVDPMNPKEVANAINFFFDNPEIAQNMGINGQRAVMEKYNWQQEERKLLKLYQELNNL